MANQFGEKIKKIRETRGLLQRQVSADLEIDGPMLSKIERGQRKAKKEQVSQFAKILKTDLGELHTLWLADQLMEIVEGEALALKAIQVAEDEVKYITRKRK